MPKTEPELGVQKLLTYLPDYGVLVCKACQFAIQPSALSSHLLKHQIYRSERRELLQQLSDYALKDPEDVASPDATTSPIPELPVHRGLICEVEACGHACVADKRMKQHWSDEHGSKDVKARGAWLQTWFRGNKIRYFEVSEGRDLGTPVTDDSDGSPAILLPQNSVPSKGPDRATSEAESSLEWGDWKQLNTLDLQLMHQWSTITSHTASRGTESSHFWTFTIPNLGFTQHPFLLHGCLAVAAFHLAFENKNNINCQKYHQIAREYESAGLALYRKALVGPLGKASMAFIAFNRLLALSRCAEHHLDPENVDSATRPEMEGRSLPILECIMLLRGSTNMLVELQGTLPRDSEFRLPGDVLSGLQTIPHDESIEHIFSAPGSNYPNVPPRVYDNLLSIPPKLLHLTVNSPNLATLKFTFACLLTCFNRSYASLETWAQWNGVEAWPRMLPEEFLRMIEFGEPSALVLLAIWALLVRRLEVQCWFLKGETERVFKFVRVPLEETFWGLVQEIEEVAV